MKSAKLIARKLTVEDAARKRTVAHYKRIVAVKMTVVQKNKMNVVSEPIVASEVRNAVTKMNVATKV